MPIDEVVQNYLQLIRTEHFAKYEKDFAYRLQIALSNAYLLGLYEDKMVSLIEKIINKLNGLSASANQFRISTGAIFIHGNTHQVEFEYYGQSPKPKIELGDLIFIISVVYKGRKYFEKFTISQFKKDNARLSWTLSKKEQLYLLSRFPSFRGIKGSLVPMKEHNLPNYSGCLGAYNLLYRPGDFSFIGARRLEAYMGNRKSLNIKDIFALGESITYCLGCPYQHCSWGYNEELRYLCREIFRHAFPYPILPADLLNGVLGSSCYAPHVHDFVDKYLRGYIGELSYAELGVYNVHAQRFLRELLSVVEGKAQKENKREIVEFVGEFFNYPYGGNDNGGGERDTRQGQDFDYEGGGLGIIHTIINLGER